MDARARSSYVSISEVDRSADLDYVATVHHGVDLTGLPFTRDAGPGLAAFGRIHPDKGTHTAIEIARRAGRPLTICGIVQDERATCRTRTGQRFGADRVVTDYLTVYDRLTRRSHR
ncbi:hypothetical protein [Micromonospora haikouensis]|uniref:hypothetical protein n=1 Tax=Micromonospora haikouensis TaxID=686309 RepID=UPI003D8A92CB